MSYFLEIWLRGFAKDYVRSLAEQEDPNYHPHITIVRPFDTSDESQAKKTIVEICKKYEPIGFTLEGRGSFNKGKIPFVDVKNTGYLLKLDFDLESALDEQVEFVQKLDDVKKFHVTIPTNVKMDMSIDQYMLRLTALKDKRIWFSYDFVTKKVLSREDSLDKTLWLHTVHQFTQQSGLMPTRNGYISIQ